MSTEKVKSESIVAGKAYAFALEIVKVFKLLTNERKEYVLSKQLLRSGTSIGANINEAISGQSKRDFVYKLNIELKEARETVYWLNLLKDSEYINVVEFESLNNKCSEIIKMLSSIICNNRDAPKRTQDPLGYPYFTTNLFCTKRNSWLVWLDLSLSYDIVKTHGGKINVKSEEGKGSEFIIELPINPRQ